MLFLQVICMWRGPSNGRIKNQLHLNTFQVTAKNLGDSFGEQGGFPDTPEVHLVLVLALKVSLSWSLKTGQGSGDNRGWILCLFPVALTASLKNISQRLAQAHVLEYLRCFLVSQLLPATVTWSGAHSVSAEVCGTIVASSEFFA